jgi:nucleoside-diphosphate-sugar epimerase
VRIARIFNTYGPRMHPNDGRVVSNFIVQALRGEPITIYGDGQQTRSFCFVDDLVEGLCATCDAGPMPGPVNLGNPVEFTMLQLAEQVIAGTGSNRRRIVVENAVDADSADSADSAVDADDDGHGSVPQAAPARRNGRAPRVQPGAAGPAPGKAAVSTGGIVLPSRVDA